VYSWKYTPGIVIPAGFHEFADQIGAPLEVDIYDND